MDYQSQAYLQNGKKRNKTDKDYHQRHDEFFGGNFKFAFHYVALLYIKYAALAYDAGQPLGGSSSLWRRSLW